MNQSALPDTAVGAKPGQTLKFSAFELLDSIRRYTCSSIGENLHNFHYTDNVIQSLEKVFGIDLSKKYRTRGDIKKIIADVKK